MLKNPEMLNRFIQKVELEEVLSDAGITFAWSFYDESDAAVVDLGDGYDLFLWVPNQNEYRKPQYLLGELSLDDRTICVFRGESVEDAVTLAYNALMRKEKHLQTRNLWESVGKRNGKGRARCAELTPYDVELIMGSR